MTVGELRKKLSEYPDDLKVFIKESNTMEKKGWTSEMYVAKCGFKITHVNTYDAFDFELYSYDCAEIVYDEDKMEGTVAAVAIS